MRRTDEVEREGERTVTAPPSGAQARQRLGEAVAQLERPLPKVAALLEEVEEDILAF